MSFPSLAPTHQRSDNFFLSRRIRPPSFLPHTQDSPVLSATFLQPNRHAKAGVRQKLLPLFFPGTCSPSVCDQSVSPTFSLFPDTEVPDVASRATMSNLLPTLFRSRSPHSPLPQIPFLPLTPALCKVFSLGFVPIWNPPLTPKGRVL